MPCLLGCLALLTPRIVIVLVVLFSDYIGRAYDLWVWPLLGFFFLPLTTLAYAFAHNQTGGALTPFYYLLVLIAVLVDIGMVGGGGVFGKRKYRTIRK